MVESFPEIYFPWHYLALLCTYRTHNQLCLVLAFMTLPRGQRSMVMCIFNKLQDKEARTQCEMVPSVVVHSVFHSNIPVHIPVQ